MEDASKCCLRERFSGSKDGYNMVWGRLEGLFSRLHGNGVSTQSVSTSFLVSISTLFSVCCIFFNWLELPHP
ncbi:hypothetical protein BU26DRAFT_120479 [Trematosphaeria pertusa]|uniref:Uncharacterized protein n=1 Tax=Trematosphaeria pertusa TaxID=390896 RepID=A0A6A6HYM0_9PLEO|nr:uncharacterized protein BU26DRAFT_120479 [Trematosphaeria pertusa]KAF2242878.1 hypothetical protein BU26DRAFT_120479 [Trematosphaeria pertusa]